MDWRVRPGESIDLIQRTHELGTGLLGSIIALITFAYILWGISAITPLPLFGVNLAVPGYLIWTALVYAGTGTLHAVYGGASAIFSIGLLIYVYSALFRWATSKYALAGFIVFGVFANFTLRKSLVEPMEGVKAVVSRASVLAI